jgi:hypothetical protein
MTADDALRVINFLNSNLYKQISGSGGEGEGEAAGLAVSRRDGSSAVPSISEIPLVLLASPDVVLEVRDRPTAAVLADDQTNSIREGAQDLALLALHSTTQTSGGIGLAAASKMKKPLGPLDSQTWDELITSLATDLENTAQQGNE